jgi:hypothetical protein
MKINASFSLMLAIMLAAGLQANAKNYWAVNMQHPSDSLKLVEFAGKYNFKKNSTIRYVTVKIEKNSLVAIGSDENVYELEKDAQKPDTFTIPYLNAEVYFVRDAAKKITGMKVVLQGQDLVADKEPAKN